MKTTKKEYLVNYDRRQSLTIRKIQARETSNFELSAACHEEIQVLNTDYFDKLPTVNVSYSIGHRNYFENVVKIGKTYFDVGSPMTKNRGYMGITEINEITESMKNNMISDTLYY